MLEEGLNHVPDSPQESHSDIESASCADRSSQGPPLAARLLLAGDSYVDSVPRNQDADSEVAFRNDLTESGECVLDCCTDDINDPCQVRNPEIISQSRKRQGSKYRQFQPVWYERYPWLVLCMTKLKAFCHLCKYCTKNKLLEHPSDSAFVSLGYDNWKRALERFQRHADCLSHKEAAKKVMQIQRPGIDCLLDGQCLKSQQLHRRMLYTVLSSLRFLVRQGLAIRGHDEMESNLMQLLLLRCDDIPDLKRWLHEKRFLSSDISNEVVKIMSNRLLRGLLQDIRDTSYFSLIVDEATDTCHQEQLSISVRWVDDVFEIHETVIQLINVPKTDSATLTACIKDCLVRLGLPLSQCRGQAYDGAANMSGHIRGVAAQIQEIEPTAVYVHCLAHSTNLSLQAVGKNVLPIRDALDLVMEVGQLIRFSPKRSSLFSSLQEQMSPGSPSLKPLCPTRWTVRTRAIEAVIANYGVLTEALTEIHDNGRDEYALKAGGYLTAMERFSTYFGLKLSHLVFSATEQLSVSLQSKNTTVQEAIGCADVTKKFLQDQRNDRKFEAFYLRVVEEAKDLASEPTLPRHKRRPQRIEFSSCPGHRFEDAKSYFRHQYFEVLDTACGELERRFQQRGGMSVAATLEKLFLDASNEQRIVGDFPEEIRQYSNDVNLQNLQVQLQMLPNLIKTYNQMHPSTAIKRVTSLRTLCEVIQSISGSRIMFSEVCRLLHIALTIPVTSATAERSFSVLRRLKTYLRSTMSQQRLNHLLLLHIHKDRTDTIDLVSIAKEFISINERRLSYFDKI